MRIAPRDPHRVPPVGRPIGSTRWGVGPSAVAPLVLLSAVAALGWWRATCVLAGPDIDTDAYAHHMIARAILADPRDLAVHWVWLPLFHYAQVPLVALGGDMNHLRWINIALTGALPVLIFAYVRRTASGGPAWTNPNATALLAALFSAACPISMQMGTTAQPEPLFALLLFGVATAFQENRRARAAVLLSAAVLLRYEAWASLAVIFAFIGADKLARGHRGTGRRYTYAGWLSELKGTFADWLVVAIPSVLILFWATLRRPVDGQWFGFLRQTQEFASGAAPGSSALETHRALIDLFYYPLLVPLRVLGPCLPFVAFGFIRTLRQQGARFVGVLLACLGFVTLSWVRHASLGLDRHFVAVVPLYAICGAQGVAALSDSLTALAMRRARAGVSQAKLIVAGRAIGVALSMASLGALLVVLGVWMGFWRKSIDRGWPDRLALAAQLRSLPDSTTIFCDDATFEILSGVDRHRFDRHWIDDPHTWELVTEVARSRGVAYVATWQRKLQGHKAGATVIFHAGELLNDPNTGMAILRVTPDADQATR